MTDSTDPAVAEWHKTLSEGVLEQVREELKHTKATLEAYVIDEQDWRNDPDGIEARAERDRLREDLNQAAGDVRLLRAQNAELLSEVAEIRAQLERAVGQAERLLGYWAESSRHRAEIQDRLTRAEADAAARQVELTAAYHELGDVVAERDQLRRDLAGAVIARHEAERELADMRPDSTPTKES